MKKFIIALLLLFSFQAQTDMAPAGCAVLIVNELKLSNPAINPTEEARLITYWTAICKGLIDHIKAAAVTTTPVTSGSSAGVYTGTVK